MVREMITLTLNSTEAGCAEFSSTSLTLVASGQTSRMLLREVRVVYSEVNSNAVQSTDMNGSAGDTDLTIRPLRIEDAGTVSALLFAQPPEYARFFYAFDFNEEKITDILAKRIKDVCKVWESSYD